MPGRRLIGAAVLVLCLLAPATAWAGEDEDDEPFASFAVKASNGYRIVVYAAAEAEDEPGPRGEVLLMVMNRGLDQLASYHTKAVVTPTTLQADFGRLGRIDLVLAKSSGTRRVPLRCGGRVPIEKANYWGTFEFHGERGFTEASANRIAFNPYAFLGLVLCDKEVDVNTAGPSNPGPGALLRAFGKTSRRSALVVEAVKNRPKGRVLVRASLGEQRGRIGIVRAVELKVSAPALDYDRGLRAAVLDPPAPFSGSARFRREAEGAARWSGNLRVDLPGRANVSLTRDELRPRLRRGSWSVFDLFDRPSLGHPLALLEAP